MFTKNDHSSVHEEEKKLQENPGKLEKNEMYAVLSYPIQKLFSQNFHNSFCFISRYQMMGWLASPTKDRNSTAGQKSESQQQFLRHSPKRKIKHKEKKKKPGLAKTKPKQSSVTHSNKQFQITNMCFNYLDIGTHTC